MMMKTLDRLFRQPFRRYLPGLALGAAVALLSLWRTGFGFRLAYADALTAAGGVLLLLGLLLWTGYLGAFDIFGYSFSSLGKRRYKDLYEYSAAHRSKRERSGWYFAPFLVTGAGFLLAGIVLWL